MPWGEVALTVVIFGMLGSIGYTILLARSIELDETTPRAPSALERLLQHFHVR
ncbi:MULTISPECIES: hypothetical protein [Nocardia]|uniref:hypothetical protein n=1 Tax=Nocardia TaxID=1817 RepID=UPI001892EE5F|nr:MULTISPECIES: hypothetical protein [Nocardia]MBF6351613.1 hypothetical protein [Nocardia flavorosea]